MKIKFRGYCLRVNERCTIVLTVTCRACDNDDKLVLFYKIILAKVIYLGTADTHYINNILDPFFNWEKKKTFEMGVFLLLDSDNRNTKMFSEIVFNYTA